MNTDIFAPMPPMETLEQRIARQVARDYARNPLWSIPRPGHPAFVGPLRAFRRRALPGAERESGADGRWFLPGFDATQAVVTRGAQVLLSEEQKGLLKNENDD